MTGSLHPCASALLCIAGVACGKGDPGRPADSARAEAPGDPSSLAVAVIPKGTTHVYWKSVEHGAREAGDELGIEILWKGPLVENDRAQQIQIVEQFVSRKIAGIAIAPLDRAALRPPLAAARAAGIPVVVFDSALDGQVGKDFSAFISTDNEAAGRLAGERLRQDISGAEGEGRVVLLRYQVGSASTEAREEACLAVLAREPALQILVENRYAGATMAGAQTEALNLKERLARADGVFCSNESTTLGMLLALRQLGLAGKLRFVGFDASPPLIEALRAGEIDALVVQDPRRMGQLAVATLAAAVRGQPYAETIATKAVLVTRENLDCPEIRRLLE